VEVSICGRRQRYNARPASTVGWSLSTAESGHPNECVESAEGGFPKQPSQQANLTDMDRFVEWGKEQSPEFHRVDRVRHVRRFRQDCRRELPSFRQGLEVNLVEQSKHFVTRRIELSIVVSLRTAAKVFSQPTRHQFHIPFGPTALTKEHQPVLGNSQMPYLPTDMRRSAGGNAKPFIGLDIREQAVQVLPGKLHLANGQIAMCQDLISGRDGGRHRGIWVGVGMVVRGQVFRDRGEIFAGSRPRLLLVYHPENLVRAHGEQAQPRACPPCPGLDSL